MKKDEEKKVSKFLFFSEQPSPFNWPFPEDLQINEN